MCSYASICYLWPFSVFRSNMIRIYIISHVCPASHLAWQQLKHYLPTVQSDLFIPVIFIGIIDHYHFIPPWLRVTRSMENKTCWFHYFEHFSTEKNKIYCGIEAIRTEHTKITLEWEFLCKRNNCCFTDDTKNHFQHWHEFGVLNYLSIPW